MTWPDAIARVLEEQGEPTHYRDITTMIGERGLRSLTGAKPADTVRGAINRMINEAGNPHYGKILRIGSGVFELVNTSDQDSPEESAEDDDFSEDDSRIRVSSYGLYWEREKVNWNKGMVLGRQTSGADPVNFAEQKGVYMLYRDHALTYVGRAIGPTSGLFSRLKRHTRDHKALRWNRFSWFGFRPVTDEGNLGELPGPISTEDHIIILEAVMIEALDPPINRYRGDNMGDMFEQVADYETAGKISGIQ